jgi:hypothetical protein
VASRCKRCFGGKAEAAWKAMASLRVVATLIDESHFRITVRVCPTCEQHAVQLFAESVDWQDGEDPQMWAVVPLSREEADALTARGEAVTGAEVCALAANRRYLYVDHPSKGPRTVTWMEGGLVIPPHD